MKLRILVAALFVSAAIVKPALAGTVYQQSPDRSDAEFSDQVQQLYDNFTPSSANVDSLTWYGTYLNAPPSVFTINFYADSSGEPGASLGAADVVPTNGTLTGNIIAGNSRFAEYVYSASLTPLTLVPGDQYWIEITADTDDNWLWDHGNGGDGSAVFFISGLGPNPTPVDLAFTLTGDGSTSPVPEPSSLMLMSTGVLGAFGFGRRKIFRS